MNSAATLDHQVVSKSRWFSAYSDFLAKEKDLTRLSDELSRQRRELPWTLVEKEYVFEGPQGKVSLADLFNGRSQLATYHFMFGPDWAEGCPSCSYVTDHLDGALEHLQARDVTLVLVSRGPLDKLQAFKKRMGWRLPWFSSGGCDFNRDFGVSFTKAEVDSRAKAYNFGTTAPHGEENPGLSFFFKRSERRDPAHVLDLWPRPGIRAGHVCDPGPGAEGRDEAGLPMPMAWVRHHDKYEPTLQGAGSCCHNKAGH